MGTTSAVGQYNATPPVLTDGEQRILRLDAASRLISTVEKRATYSASIINLAVVTGATDFWTISGSATKTIIVKRLLFSGTAQATAQCDINMLVRSSANSGGSSSAISCVPHDSTNAACTATVLGYTANPTLGTLVGLIRSVDYTLVAENSNAIADIREFDFGTEEDQGIVLRGTSELLALNFNADAGNSVKIHVSVEWREIVGG